MVEVTVKRSMRAQPAWPEPFIAALRQFGRVRPAADRAGTKPQTVYDRRKKHPEFAAAWDAALGEFKARAAALPTAPAGPPVKLSKRAQFLEALAETSNVLLSAQRAGLPLREMHKLRRKDAAFAAEWRAALMEGYDMLEMELLGHLRNPIPARKMDVGSAMRLLAAHRETVLRERALREDDDEEAVLASLDRFIDDMRARREANAALVLEYRAANPLPHGEAGEQGEGGNAAG